MQVLRGGVSVLTMSGKVPTPWYLADGDTLAHCVAAYQAKGAASLAASYVNLAHPGVNDAAPGVAPSWAAATGWGFVAASEQYLSTGINPGTGWTAIVRFSDAAAISGYLFGNDQIAIRGMSGTHRYLNAPGAITVSGSVTNGVLAVTNHGYLNGSDDGTLTGSLTGTLRDMIIGAVNNVGTISLHVTANIKELAIYNVTKTGPQIALLTTAMNAL